MLSIIVATARDHAIGYQNQLLWHMPADLKFFKETTQGHTVIMGRKTFDSVGKPLPRRRNIIVTRQDDFKVEGAEIVHSLQEALKLCEPEEEHFIVGGAQIYAEALAYTDRIYLTVIDGIFNADTYFPSIDPQAWELLSSEPHPADAQNPYAYNFKIYQRKA